MPELSCTVAVFAQADQLILVGLEKDGAERAVSDAVGRGYVFAGSIAVVSNEPKVAIEPGYAATMALAGAVFAEMLGKQIQESSRRSHAEN